MSNRISLVTQNDDLNIRIYRSQEIIDRQDDFIKQIEDSRQSLRNIFPDIDSTWGYNLYNLFSVSAGFPLFYNLYKDMQFIVRDYLQTDEPLWIQMWANYHNPNQVLDWHTHAEWACHGFVSIRPHKTQTLFDGYATNNEVGNIYIGPSNRLHKVYVEENYDTPRITCGYDVVNEEMFREKRANNDINISLIPL